MSAGKIFLNQEEQIFLMEFLELKNPKDAAEKFALIMVEERADPTQMKKYLQKIIKNHKEKK
jgi:hypothetical protein